jgi:hypothetical protein
MSVNIKLKNLALGLVLLVLPSAASAGVAVSINIAPPVLPVYVQPPCPTDGDLWTPGYWAWGPDGYYWVPGVWVAPPRVGVLWTPGYWGFVGGNYLWHAGYWGPHVGFYGGVNYGFGYGGIGFGGGIWAGNVFRYNSAVLNVNTAVVRNVYVDRTVIRNVAVSHVSFNGPGGIRAQASAQELSAAREQHFQPTSNQMSHEQTAARDRTQLASANHGHPGTPAMDAVNGRRFNQQGRIGNGTPAPQQRQQVSRQPGPAAKPQQASRQPGPAAKPQQAKPQARPEARPAPAGKNEEKR